MHILTRAPGDERHLYRLSIHGSIDFGPCVLVSTCGTWCWNTRKSPIFAQIRPLGSQRRFLPTFEEISTRNIFVSTSRMKTIKVWKVFKNFQTFRKFWKKGLGAPTKHPNLQMKFWQKLKIFNFCQNFICRFGCFVGAPSPFFQNFRKVWKFLKTFHTLIVFIREVLTKIFRVEISSKVGKNRLWDPKGRIWAKIGDFRVFQHQVPQVDTKTHGPKSILPWIESLYRCLSSPGARVSMCTHQAH